MKLVIDAPDILKNAIFVSTFTGTVTVTVPETIPDAPAPIQNVLCVFSNGSDASGPASEYKTVSIAEQDPSKSRPKIKTIEPSRFSSWMKIIEPFARRQSFKFQFLTETMKATK